MSASVKEFSKAWWLEVYNRIIGAVVFIDDYSAECLHWDGGLFNLINGGAVAVKSLSPFESTKKEHRKVVFITQATSTQLRTISEIIRNGDFTHCILISCVSLDIVYLELNEGKDVSDIVASGRASVEAAKYLENMLIESCGKKQCVVEVVFIPIFTIAPTNVVFLTPPYHEVYPMFDDKLTPDSQSIDLYSLTSDQRSSLRRLTSSLNSMLNSMNMKEDVYYMGTFSSLIAGILENSPVCVSRRKNCTNPVSLIIVDRTLDLCGVMTHSTESVLDKVMAVLPRFPGHSNEVAVDMSALCEANVISHPDDIQLSPGCLYHANDDSCLQTYDHMINKSQKEVMFDLYNKLSKIDVNKSPGPKTLLKVTPQSVEKIITASKGNYDIIGNNLGILQQALGVVQTLKSPKRVQFELLMSLERQVLQNLAASRESTSVLHQMSHLIKTRKERDLPLENLLALLIHVYSLTGNEVIFNKQHEESVQDALSVAIFEDHKNLHSTFITADVVMPEECEVLAKRIMARLKEISQMRKNLHKFSSVLRPCESGSGHEYSGVLQQLVGSLVDSERPDLTDLSHRHDGIKDLLRTGLNILTSKRKTTKHPLDNSTVIIYVVGGVTAEECKQIHRTVITSGVDNNVLIGSTKLVTPVEAMRFSSVLRPCESGSGHEYSGVLQQLVGSLVDSERPDLTDLSHRHDGIKDLLRTGLNILTSKRKTTKHPLDNSTVIIYVVGGVTAEECKQIHRTVITSGVDNNVLIGSTKLVTPVEAMRFSSVLRPCESGSGHEYSGVLQQLVGSLVDSERPDLTDLSHRHDGIKDLLRTGLNILTSKRKTTKHPLDNSTVIIYVVGGVTAEECKQIHRTVITSGVDNNVLIGSTKLVTPVEAMRDVLNLR